MFTSYPDYGSDRIYLAPDIGMVKGIASVCGIKWEQYAYYLDGDKYTTIWGLAGGGNKGVKNSRKRIYMWKRDDI